MRADGEVTVRLEDDGHGWFDVFVQAGPNYPLYEDERFIGTAPIRYLRKRIHRVDNTSAETTLRTVQQIERLSRIGWPDKKARRILRSRR